MRIEVVGGGEPSAEELAAITAALEEMAAIAAREATSDDALPGWVVAALHEGIGGVPAVAPPAPVGWV